MRYLRPHITLLRPLFLACLILSSFCTAAQDSLRKERLLKDIDAYREGIERLHASPFTRISKATFEQQLDSIKQASPGMNADEVLVAMMRVNALLADEHTRILYTDSTAYPYVPYWFKEGVYIALADSAHSAAAHTKLLAVNGRPLDTIIAVLRELLPDKNIMSVRSEVPALLQLPAILHGCGLTDAVRSIDVLSLNDAGDTLHTMFSAIPSAQRKMDRLPAVKKMLRNSREGNYWYHYDTASGIFYFNYSRCFDEKDKTFEKFDWEMEREIRKNKPSRIVIDLRNNGGGNSGLLKPFISFLKGSRLDEKGKIFVLIGRRTFSAAVLNAVSLKRETHAILAGEASSGSVNHFGDIRFFDLPACGARVCYSTRYIKLNTRYDGPVLPDLKMEEQFADYIKGVDALLDYVSIVKVE